MSNPVYFIDITELPPHEMMQRANPEWFSQNGGNPAKVDQLLDALYPYVTMTYLQEIGEPWRTLLLDRIVGFGDFPGDDGRMVTIQLADDFEERAKAYKKARATKGRELTVEYKGEWPSRGRPPHARKLSLTEPTEVTFKMGWELFCNYGPHAEDPAHRGLIVEVLERPEVEAEEESNAA